MTSTFDVVVIGAGAAGLAAAIEAASLGMSAAILDGHRPGGALASMARVETVAGHPVGLTGPEFVERAVTQANRFGVAVECGSPATRLTNEGNCYQIVRAAGQPLTGRTVIIATGADRRLPPIPGLAELLGVGVFTAMPNPLPAPGHGRDVVVVGEPVASAAAALTLSDCCGTVTLATHAPGNRSGIATPTRIALRSRTNVVVRYETELKCAVGRDHLESVVLRRTGSGHIIACDASALFVLTAATPRSQWLPSAVARNAGGFVLAGDALGSSTSWPLSRRPFPSETSLPGAFVVGGVRHDTKSGVAAIADAIATIHQIKTFLRS